MADEKKPTPLTECKKQLSAEADTLFNNSERSGNTPTEDQFKDWGKRMVRGIVNLYAKNNSITDGLELGALQNQLNAYFNSEVEPKYKHSMSSSPRKVNGEMPVEVTDSSLANYKQALKDEKKNVTKNIRQLMQLSASTGRTPGREQSLAWLKNEMRKNFTSGDEQKAKYVDTYIDNWMQREYDLMLSNSLKYQPRQINGHWPWKTDDQEREEKELSYILPSKKKIHKIPSIYPKLPFTSDYMKTYQSFSGYDMVCTIEMYMPKGGTYTQVIGELQTITYSIHQEKSPIRCLGDMNAKGYVFGPRTIAGTLIFTVFDRHWTTKMEKEYLADAGVRAHMLADEFPPFNLTISCANEYGHDAVCSIFGITLVNEGQVMSINDVFTENTYQFYATDVQYLAPVEVTMGGTKNQPINIPGVNRNARPAPELPTPLPKNRTPLPKLPTQVPSPDPQKPAPRKELLEPRPQMDNLPSASSAFIRQDAGMTREDYDKKLKELNRLREQQYEMVNEAVQHNSASSAYERIQKVRIDNEYAKAKTALDQQYKASQTEGGQ